MSYPTLVVDNSVWSNPHLFKHAFLYHIFPLLFSFLLFLY